MAVSQPHTSEDPSSTALWKLRFVLACGVPPPCLVPCGCKTGKMCQPLGRSQMSGKDRAARGEQVAPSQHTAWPPCAPSTGCQERVDAMRGCSPVVGKGRTGHIAHPQVFLTSLTSFSLIPLLSTHRHSTIRIIPLAKCLKA